MPETWFAVEMTTTSGEEFYAVLRDREALADYVMVNADDELCCFKISAADPSILAKARIEETFADA